MSKSIEYQKISQSPEESQESSEEMNVNVSNIPSSQSSTQLIRNNLGNSESGLNENESINDDKTLERRSRLDSTSSSRVGYSSVSSKEWFTVSVLCFINLINYMDRFTIAGKLKI
jgi:MFS transporter, Spinster family, sphingosine-1-phosphate transporter